MAITKTSELSEIMVRPAVDSTAADTANAKYPTINVWYFDTFTDSGVASNPINRSAEINKYVEDGGADSDVSGEDSLVQSIATAIWS
jgi:hypothetical protein|tara:strand:+ start:1348 stop:1608 length:261 start_codon:yes stop_codon:yes gene_type:complete